jgi:hypothetical protein
VLASDAEWSSNEEFVCMNVEPVELAWGKVSLTTISFMTALSALEST